MRSLKKLVEVYEKNFSQYGDNNKGVGWKSKKAANKRYQVVSTEIKKYTQLLSDAEWEGRIDDISFITKQLDHYKKLMADGQLYEPKF